MGDNTPRITFGIIVLNGEPFTSYCLRALYPFAHEIIVVEGACRAAAAVATPDGHSTDGTLEVLRRFKAEEDPEGKVQVITRDGFWSEKDEQSWAYAERATGDYLWQVDIDEFYRPEDVRAVLAMLRAAPSITAVSFKQIQFWGGFDYYVDSWYLRRRLPQIHRLFRWGPGYVYKIHRPPTVLTAEGVDTRSIKWLNAYEMACKRIFLYHYSLVFPRQVSEKCKYYGTASWARRPEAERWFKEVFLELKNPYRAHNVYDYPGWLERFRGRHPPQIEALRADTRAGKIGVELRPTGDIERLLRSPWYRLGRVCLKSLEPWDRCLLGPLRYWAGRLLRLFTDPIGSLRALKRKARRFLDRTQ